MTERISRQRYGLEAFRSSQPFAKRDLRSTKVLKKLSRQDGLIIDHLGYATRRPQALIQASTPGSIAIIRLGLLAFCDDGMDRTPGSGPSVGNPSPHRPRRRPRLIAGAATASGTPNCTPCRVPS